MLPIEVLSGGADINILPGNLIPSYPLNPRHTRNLSRAQVTIICQHFGNHWTLLACSWGRDKRRRNRWEWCPAVQQQTLWTCGLCHESMLLQTPLNLDSLWLSSSYFRISPFGGSLTSRLPLLDPGSTSFGFLVPDSLRTSPAPGAQTPRPPVWLHSGSPAWHWPVTQLCGNF